MLLRISNCMFSSAIAIYSLFHKYYPRRAVFAWSPPMNVFLHIDFSRITATYRLTMIFIGMPTEFMQLILQTCSWLKTMLVMGINIILKWKFTFVQTSRFTDVISDNDSKRVWKTFLFLQTCTTREYDWIKMRVLTDVFSRVLSTKWTVYLLFTTHLQTGRRLIWRHFHTPMWEHS